ncbi:MAG: HAD family hydrolase [Roseibium sp.]
MPKNVLTTTLWLLFLGLSVGSLTLAVAINQNAPFSQIRLVVVFSHNSTLVYCMFSAIFAFLCLSFSLNSPLGRPLTLFTAIVSAFLIGSSAILNGLDVNLAQVDLPALAAAFMMILRTLSIGILPPRGDRSGTREGFLAISFASVSGTVWWVVDPLMAPIAATTCLLLSWPFLIDGINAFADKVYLQAANAAGARNIKQGAFTQVARARDIVLDKTAVMSGPNLMVTNVMAFNNEPKTLLAVAASAESGSDHPVAHALRQLAVQWQVDLKRPDLFEPEPGLGVVALLGGQTVVIGSTELLKKLKIDSFTADAIARSLEEDGKTVLRVAVGGRVVGVLGLEGTLRQDAGVAGLALRSEGLVPWLYSGDSLKTRKTLADLLGLEVVDDPVAGETIAQGTARTFGPDRPLILTLSPDRSALELRSPTRDQPLAISNTDDIGAFPALKALAMRRNKLAVQARRILMGLWVLGGLCGGLTLLPMSSAPMLLVLCLGILWGFARFSVADTLKGRML